MRVYEQTLQLASAPTGPVLRGTADMYVGMSEIHRERDELAAAAQCLRHQYRAGGASRLAAEPLSLPGRVAPDT